jgi:hypothetical protein
MDKKCGAYTQWNIIQPQKETNSLIAATQIELEITMLNEITLIQEGKYFLVSLICRS